MKFFAVLVLAALAVLGAAVDVPFTNCAENSIIKLETLTATMWPPKKETDFAMTTTGSASKAIAGGEFKMATKFSGIDVDTKTGPLCEFGDVACPIKAGAVTIVNEGVLPGNAPAGQYSLKTSATSADGEVVFCYTVTFSL